MSDEFVDVMLGKLIQGLRPGLWDSLPEATLNAGLATVDSLNPEAEHQAVMAVQFAIIAFSGQHALQLSQRHLMREYVDFYGNYAVRLLRLHNELLRTYDRHKRGNKHTMEIHHVHIHNGGQGVVGMINMPKAGEGSIQK
jgi:hypothetical protein